jgi:hypothetical protein
MADKKEEHAKRAWKTGLLDFAAEPDGRNRCACFHAPCVLCFAPFAPSRAVTGCAARRAPRAMRARCARVARRGARRVRSSALVCLL